MLLPLAAFLFASCSSDNDEQTVANGPQAQKVPEGAIYFTSGLQETRATYTEDNFNAFKVTGVHANPSYAFTDLSVSRTGSIWTYNPTEDESLWKFWPVDNSEVKFFAYAPTTLSNVSIDMDAQVITGFTQKQKVAEHIDVLAAAAAGNKSNNASSGMTLDFKHALAQIEVRAKNSAPNTYQVKVLGVKLCRVKNGGNMTFQTLSDNYPVWGSLTGSKSYIVEGTEPMTMTSSVQNIMFGSDNFLMLPQQLTAWSGSSTDETGAYLSVLCQIVKLDDNSQVYPKVESTEAAGKFGFSCVPISTKWEPGHKYVYTLDFFGAGGGAGQVDPNPTNPETKDGGNDDPSAPQGDSNVDTSPLGGVGPGDEGYDPNDPTTHTGETHTGDPIIPDAAAKIKFTVTITDWINGQGDNETLDL